MVLKFLVFDFSLINFCKFKLLAPHAILTDSLLECWANVEDGLVLRLVYVWEWLHATYFNVIYTLFGSVF